MGETPAPAYDFKETIRERAPARPQVSQLLREGLKAMLSEDIGRPTRAP